VRKRARGLRRRPQGYFGASDEQAMTTGDPSGSPDAGTVAGDGPEPAAQTEAASPEPAARTEVAPSPDPVAQTGVGSVREPVARTEAAPDLPPPKEAAPAEWPVSEVPEPAPEPAEPLPEEAFSPEPTMPDEQPAASAEADALDVDEESEEEDGPAPRLARTAELPSGPVLQTAKLPEPPVGAMAPMELPRVIAIANQKGGVGKTTTTVNLGAALAEIGFRVLVLDLDPQGNATTGLGLNPRDVEGSVYDVLLSDVTLDDIIEPTSLKNLFVAPATIDLAGAEIELVPVMSRELRLRRAIEVVRDDYDLVLIDCPPSLGLLTVNGLAASDDVIVPIQCEYYALEGLGQLLRNVGLVQANLNPTLDVRGIVLTMYDARTKLADQVVTEVRSYFGAKVYETIVPRTVRLSEAPSFGQPIIVFDSTSRGAKAYRDLAKEVSRGATRRTG
jgi:chromosome partitioning protein